MPYIPQKDRFKYDDLLEALTEKLKHSESLPGDLNYCISKIIWELWEENRSYTVGNNLIGALECAKIEFYRQILVPYEDSKVKENGML